MPTVPGTASAVTAGGWRWMWVAAIVVATIAGDRATKHFAGRHLIGAPRRSYLSDMVRIEYTENRGGFLGLGATLPPPVRSLVFTAGTLALLAVVSAVLARRGTGTAATIGLSLLWAGGASNLADRMARGAVVDFLNLGLGPLRTGIFNVADVAITAGVLVLFFAPRRPHSDSTSPGV